jgi:hypothetical protein
MHDVAPYLFMEFGEESLHSLGAPFLSSGMVLVFFWKALEVRWRAVEFQNGNPAA